MWKQNQRACETEELKLGYPVVSPDGKLEETIDYLNQDPFILIVPFNSGHTI